MTKAQEIVYLRKTKPKLSNRQIAEIVGCGSPYVRAALARHKAGGRRPADKAYTKREAAHA